MLNNEALRRIDRHLDDLYQVVKWAIEAHDFDAKGKNGRRIKRCRCMWCQQAHKALRGPRG